MKIEVCAVETRWTPNFPRTRVSKQLVNKTTCYSQWIRIENIRILFKRISYAQHTRNTLLTCHVLKQALKELKAHMDFSSFCCDNSGRDKINVQGTIYEASVPVGKTQENGELIFYV